MFGVRSAKAFSYQPSASSTSPSAQYLGESHRIDVLLLLERVELVELVARTGDVSAGRVGDTQPGPRQRRGPARDSSLGNFGLREGFLAVFLEREGPR